MTDDSPNKNELKIKKEPDNQEEENYKPGSNINLNESSSSDSDSESDKKNNSKSSKNTLNDDVESLSGSIDEERMTLGMINKMARIAQKKKEELNIKSFLKQKRHLDNNVITYDEKKGKILNKFCGSIEDLNEFLDKCEIKKIGFEDLAQNKDEIILDPNEWLKENNIIQKTITLEDLQVFYQKKATKKKAKEKEKEKK